MVMSLMRNILSLLIGCLIGALCLSSIEAEELLGSMTLHRVQLELTSDQWQILEPKEREPLSDPRRFGSGVSRDTDFSQVHADLRLDNQLITNVALRYKGHGTYRQSRAGLKRPFKLDLNGFSKGRSVEGTGKINFNNTVADPSFMNEAIAYELYRQAGVAAPKTAYAEVSVTVLNRYTNRFLGLYTVVENPDQSWASRHFGTRKGMILKPTSQDLFHYKGDDWWSYRENYDPKTTVQEAQARRLIVLARLVTLADDEEFSRRVPEFIDLAVFARFMAVTVAISSLDSILGPEGNLIVYLDPRTRQFVFVPWDLDQAFGGVSRLGTQEQRERLSLSKPWSGTNRFLERMFHLNGFQTAYRAGLETLLVGPFQTDWMAAKITSYAVALRPIVTLEGPLILDRFERSLAGETVPPLGPDGQLQSTGPTEVTNFSRPIRSFVEARRRSLLRQLSGEEEGLRIESTHFETVTVSVAARFAAKVATKLDRDGNGTITRTEMAQALEGYHAEWTRSTSSILTLAALSKELRAWDDVGLIGRSVPAEFLARRILSQLDRDRSGGLSRSEFSGGFLLWFTAWIKSASGQIDVASITEHLTTEILSSH
ncbi:MAG: hypothetical protein EXS25_08325 [Pedosphaera sp.]|nr:hypothetical protein [Pedosphaera sp.]